MSNKEEALKPIKTLKQRLTEIAKELDVEIEQFIYVPESDSHPDLLQVVFFVTADAVLTADEKEQKAIDAKFSEIEQQFKQTPVDKRVEEIKKNRDAVKDLFKFDD